MRSSHGGCWSSWASQTGHRHTAIRSSLLALLCALRVLSGVYVCVCVCVCVCVYVCVCVQL